MSPLTIFPSEHQALMDGLAAGDEAATDRILEKYENLIYTVAFSKLRDSPIDDRVTVAEEITCEAFARLWRFAVGLASAAPAARPEQSTEPSDPIKALLLSITENLVTDRLRKEESSARVINEYELIPHKKPRTPEEMVLGRERRRYIRRAFWSLDRHLRAVATLSLIERLPIRKAAHRLGISTETFKKRLSSARKRLRKELEPLWKGANNATDDAS